MKVLNVRYGKNCQIGTCHKIFCRYVCKHNKSHHRTKKRGTYCLSFPLVYDVKEQVKLPFSPLDVLLYDLSLYLMPYVVFTQTHKDLRYVVKRSPYGNRKLPSHPYLTQHASDTLQSSSTKRRLFIPLKTRRWDKHKITFPHKKETE